MKSVITFLFIAIVSIAAGCAAVTRSESADTRVAESAPQPADRETAKGTATAVFAGGCFWGVEAVFEHVKGVTDVKSGYAGGDAKSANYDQVSEGATQHAEAVIVTFDPAQVTYGQLLKVFFTVAHNPTELNRQGPDTGPQYRSAIFFTDDTQKKQAEGYIAELETAKAFPKPIVTQLGPLAKFYDAEAYHQDYMKKTPMAVAP